MPSPTIDTLDRIVAFLNQIGIATREGEVPADAFLPGVRVHEGGLIFDRAALRWPGDLLHEAGHLAVAPPALRAQLSGDIELPADIPHASEIEATAWAWAALCHLGLEPSVLFHEGGYHGRSEGLIRTYSLGVHPGAFGLAQIGLTHAGAANPSSGVPAYPHMTQWLRQA
ncbi:hypothetical protein [Oleiagrimonas sp. MCCC 1A03011]|uniref:hypothetical protein n=1 Tax=Oleiagrimonas sp. MCCC 1A03011 TaxID=1926883 RepID=UPI000DC20662|nr:hypothetical protein [Oleiagrimonas sp. MCCC 1A03011]RAP57075.1 hypothetical protein BTJ49_10880 [Oleiagrimonas sp. MCCC 1A03011]